MVSNFFRRKSALKISQKRVFTDNYIITTQIIFVEILDT